MIVSFAFGLSELINVSDTKRTVKDGYLYFDWLIYAFADYVNNSCIPYRPNIPDMTIINNE